MKLKKLCSWLVVLALVVGLVPQIQLVSAATTTQYEAEDSTVCDSSTANKIHTGTSNASGGKAATMYTGKYVTFTVAVEEAGTYDVIMNLAANSNPAGSTVTDIPLEITVNDGTAQSFSMTNNKNYNSFTEYTYTLDLVAGTNTIVFKNVCEDATIFVNLDYISITEGEEESTEEPSTEAPTYAAAVGRHEAENANYGSNTLQNGDWYAGTSNGAVVGLNGAWEGNEYASIIWTVDAEEAGAYTLTVAYCTTAQVELKAKVNSGEWTLFSEADASTLVLPATSNWNVASTATLNVELVEGVNAIAVSGPIVDWNANWTAVYNQTGWPSANLDYIELAKKADDEETTTPEPVVVPDAVGRHEAENAISFTQGSSSGYELSYSGNYSNGVAVGGMNTWPDNGRAYCTTKVNAAEAGTYTMTIAYGGGEANHPCNIDVRVNNGEWVSTLAEPTAGWDTVATITTTIELVEGENTIDLTGACNIWYQGMGWEWVNVDYFELAKAEPEVTEYEVSVDGTVVATVEEGATYTLGDAAMGYVCGDTAYKAGTEVTVTEDLAFTTIDLSVSVAQGAGIRYTTTANGGIRFQATIDAEDAVVNSAAVEAGMLITANDIFIEIGKGELSLDSEYTYIKVINDGTWFGETGTYCGSIVNIANSNWIREFIGKAYVTITYSDGTTETVYSGMTGARSISGVAKAVQNAGYPGMGDADKAVIDTFAAAAK